MFLAIILMSCCVVVLFSSFADIAANNSYRTMHSMAELTTHIEQTPAETLFIFDVDHVLTMPLDPHFQILTGLRHRHLVKPLVASLKEEELQLMYTLMMMQSEQMLVEDITLDLLRSIQANGHRIMALTALNVAELNGKQTTSWRLEELHRLGIQLDTTFPGIEQFAITDLSPHLGRHPTYVNGVLFSNTKPDKGTVLKAFLEHLNYRPNAIVFVDDVVENIEAIEQTAAELQIPCVAIHYRGAYMTNTPDVDGQVALAHWHRLAEQARQLITAVGN